MSTMTKRNIPTTATVEKGVPMLDLGHAVVPKGTPVQATLLRGAEISGVLCGVTHKDGIPFTADVWTAEGMRFAYVEHVHPKGATQ